MLKSPERLLLFEMFFLYSETNSYETHIKIHF